MLRYQHTTRSWGLFSGYILLRGGCSVDLLASAVGAESALETSYRAAAMTVNLEAFSTITAASSTPNDRRATRETTGPAAGGGADAPSSESRRRLGAPRASSGGGGCGPLGLLLLCARSSGDEGTGSLLRSPRTFFLGVADGATALEAAEMVGAMKLLATPPPPAQPTLERTLCVLALAAPFPAASRGSFSFSAPQVRGEARPLFFQTEELLCGESAK